MHYLTLLKRLFQEENSANHQFNWWSLRGLFLEKGFPYTPI